jgi:hypothetical protein
VSEQKWHYAIAAALILGAIVLLWHMKRGVRVSVSAHIGDDVIADNPGDGTLGSQAAPVSTPIVQSYNSPQVAATAAPDMLQAYFTASQVAQASSGPVDAQTGNLASVGLPESYFVN